MNATEDSSTDLPTLLARAEQAAFHEGPADAVPVIEAAFERARSEGGEVEAAAAGWLLGVALAAGGRYGGALTVLAPLAQAGRDEQPSPPVRLFAALAGAAIASVHRQLGRHVVARACDAEALALTDGTGEAAFDAELGLASDAVGLEDVEQVAMRLTRAGELIPPGEDEWWRQRVRLGWTTAEALLLEGQSDEAVDEAMRAVERASQAKAPRHVAKGLLILGIAQVSGGQATGDDSADDDPAVTLRRAAVLAESLGCLPLVWPARALLGALVSTGDPVESSSSLAAARAAVLQIAADLPPGVRTDWLARPDVAALLEG